MHKLYLDFYQFFMYEFHCLSLLFITLFKQSGHLLGRKSLGLDLLISPVIAWRFCIKGKKATETIERPSQDIVSSDLRSCDVSLTGNMKESEVAQSCLTLCDPMDCSLLGSSVHGIFQATVLECVAISFSRGSSQPKGRTRVSRIAGRRFTIWASEPGSFG